ncbi:type II toxin-antitoxin system RelE/ParE family toxin [Dyella sp. RRB7]|uniref:type II toxin-antitoxin system RelE/ParE family toxin n=1 Tax=Dyella sp. RRB7 TaxID=2919502 RepID=UPI0024327FCF|nr:type II toxin-antitoxin system RelE/ParE family toxin [Dyella sp. RRB7]
MNTIKSTDVFDAWLASLKDQMARAKILGRINRARVGNFGDVKYFDGIGEMRVDVGPGYRVYFVKEGNTVYLLLCGGDKSSQSKDIKKAKEILAAN